MRTLAKGLALVGSAVLALSTATGAYPSWAGGTFGDETASGETMVVLHGKIAEGISPGASVSITYTADNPNDTNRLVGTITSVATVDAAHAAAGCLASDFTIRPYESNTNVPAGGTAVALGAGTLAFGDTAADQDGCKGAIIRLSITSS